MLTMEAHLDETNWSTILALVSIRRIISKTPGQHSKNKTMHYIIASGNPPLTDTNPSPSDLTLCVRMFRRVRGRRRSNIVIHNLFNPLMRGWGPTVPFLWYPPPPRLPPRCIAAKYFCRTCGPLLINVEIVEFIAARRSSLKCCFFEKIVFSVRNKWKIVFCVMYIFS